MQFSVQTIADFLQGTVEGDANALVGNFAKIEEATAGCITFLANPKYTHYIYDTGATAVIVSRDFVAEKPVKASLIRVDNPYECIAGLLSLAASHIKPNPAGVEPGAFVADDVAVPEGAYIGAGAYVAQGVTLGKNVKIYPHAYIGHNVTIGDDSVVYPNATIYYGCKIGKRCVIHAGAVIGADGFGFAPDNNGVYHKIEQIGIVLIDDDVEVGANTTIDRSTMGVTHIESGVKIDNLCQIAHNVTVGQNTVMAAQVGIAGSTKIGSSCMFGGQVGIAGHITVGDRVNIGAQSGIPNSVDAGARILGTPAMPAGAFARSFTIFKKLPELLARVDKLEKDASDKK